MGLLEGYSNRKKEESRQKAEKFWKDQRKSGCMLSLLFILIGFITITLI